jgi:hypothetical protein
VRLWIDFVTSRIIPSPRRFRQYQPKSASDPGLEEVRSDFHHQLVQFTQEMDATGPCLAQKSVWLTWLLLRGLYEPGCLIISKEGWSFLRLRNGSIDGTSGWVLWRKWRVLWVPWVRDKYLPIYQRHADNMAQSELAKATREDKDVPREWKDSHVSRCGWPECFSHCWTYMQAFLEVTSRPIRHNDSSSQRFYSGPALNIICTTYYPTSDL